MPHSKKQVNINLLVREKEEETFSGQLLSWALTYGRYIIILIQIVVLTVFFLRFKLDRDHTDLKELVEQKQSLVQSITDLETEIRRVQKRLNDIDILIADQTIPLKLLTYLQKNTPLGTTYTQISYSHPVIKFAAYSADLKSFNYLLKRLQLDAIFRDILLSDLLRRVDGRVEFKIQANLDANKFKTLVL